MVLLDLIDPVSPILAEFDQQLDKACLALVAETFTDPFRNNRRERSFSYGTGS